MIDWDRVRTDRNPQGAEQASFSTRLILAVGPGRLLTLYGWPRAAESTERTYLLWFAVPIGVPQVAVSGLFLVGLPLVLL